MIKCFRRKHVVEEWSYYLINNEIVRVNVFDLMTSFTTCVFEKVLQNNRNLREKILVEEQWDRVDERLRQMCIKNIKNDCCCRLIIRKRDISRQSLMSCVELDLENWDWNRKKSINKIVNDFELRDDLRFKKALIRNAEIFRIESINERIDAIWLRWDVFVYKQRVFLFEKCRLEIQRNQKFDRFFVNFHSFDFDCFDSNNLNSFREFDDFVTWDAFKVRRCEIFTWEHNDQFALEFRDWSNELRDDVE
jgi:hypothetical protein